MSLRPRCHSLAGAAGDRGSGGGAACHADTPGPDPPLEQAFRWRALQHDQCARRDRRGRGASGDTPPYSIEREIEDLDALIGAAGGSACVFGHFSGATLALLAAARGLAITRLALFEPPLVVGDERPRPPADLAEQLAATARRPAPDPGRADL
jgi:pimeloyl-ACP methyl ester carboxylesterase